MSAVYVRRVTEEYGRARPPICGEPEQDPHTILSVNPGFLSTPLCFSHKIQTLAQYKKKLKLNLSSKHDAIYIRRPILKVFTDNDLSLSWGPVTYCRLY